MTGIEIVSERTAIRVGQTVGPLVAYGRYDDGTTGTLSVVWSSSDPAVGRGGRGRDGDRARRGARVEITATFEGLRGVLALEVAEPTPRSTEDRPDDFPGPQIHVVYAVPSDIEDGNLDRYGDIATSFEAIQNWLADEVGRRLILDTYGGELDVTFLRLPFTHQEGDGQSGSLVFALEQAIARNLGGRRRQDLCGLLRRPLRRGSAAAPGSSAGWARSMSAAMAAATARPGWTRKWRPPTRR